MRVPFGVVVLRVLIAGIGWALAPALLAAATTTPHAFTAHEANRVDPHVRAAR